MGSSRSWGHRGGLRRRWAWAVRSGEGWLAGGDGWGCPLTKLLTALYGAPAFRVAVSASQNRSSSAYPSRDALAGDAGQAAVAKSPANARPRRSAGAATGGCGSRSTCSPTAPATGTPGPRTPTPKHAPAATTIPERSGPSGAPGHGSSGAAGKTASLTTRAAIRRCRTSVVRTRQWWRAPSTPEA